MKFHIIRHAPYLQVLNIRLSNYISIKKVIRFFRYHAPENTRNGSMRVRKRVRYYPEILPSPVFPEFNYRHSFLRIQAPLWYNRDPYGGSE